MNATENPQTPWMQNLIRVVLSGCLIAFSPQILAQEEDEGAEEEEVPAAEEVVLPAEDELNRWPTNLSSSPARA